MLVSQLEDRTTMLYTREEAQAGDLFICALSSDPEVRRRYLEADHDYVAVARLISECTGRTVETENLVGIANFVSTKHASACQELSAAYPAMNVIVYTDSH